MAANDGEARFTFDTKPFMDGLKKMSDGFTRTFSMAKKVGGFINNAIAMPIKAVKKLSGAIHSAVAPLSQAFKPAINAAKNFMGGILSVNGAMKAMPIVGQTFEFVGDVIRKNLFAPLQRELVPLLQKLIKWVTANRPLFVKMGAVIANVFRGVYTAAKAVWEVIKSIFDMITKSISRTFGGSFKDIEEAVNTIVWKVVMLMLFLTEAFKQAQDKFQPLIDKIVGFVASAGGKFVELGRKMLEAFNEGDNFQKLVDGVNSALTGISNVIGPVVTGISNLIEQLLKPDENGKTFGDVVKSLGELSKVVGELVGNAIDEFFNTFNESVKNISSTLTEIFNKFTELAGIISESGIVQKAFSALGYLLGNVIMIILVGLQTNLNNIITSFKQISVLGDKSLTWMQKWNKIKELEEERKEYNEKAWNNVQVVRQIKEGIDNVAKETSERAEAAHMQSTTAILAQANVEAIKSGGVEGLGKEDLNRANEIFGRATGGINQGNSATHNLNLLIDSAARDYKNWGGNFIEYFKEHLKDAYGEHPGYRSVNDAIITKSGQVIRTAPDDNIYAFKALGCAPRGTPPTETHITFGDVHITVPAGATSADAEHLGRAAALGFSSAIAQELSHALLLEGV
jgi:phage-related protein